MNRTLQKIPKRAEIQENEVLQRTFADSGVLDFIDTFDAQIIYGRRGTGKTHALSYLGGEVMERGEAAVYLDLRTLGSPASITATEEEHSHRATRLLVDLLGAFHERLVAAALEDEVTGDEKFIESADAFLESITRVKVVGTITRESSRNSEKRRSDESRARLTVAPKSVGLDAGATRGTGSTTRSGTRSVEAGTESFDINFGDVARAAKNLAKSIAQKRVWVLLDEWSSVPPELQPYLAEFLLRVLLPEKKFIVKIAAIEHRSIFRKQVGGRMIGFEVGADVSANINLDDFLVYEGNEERSREFFAELLNRHVANSEPPVEGIDPADSSTLIKAAFADSRAFSELVLAAEGVPRDALNIVGVAAGRALDQKITVPMVRAAARDWYQSDKLKNLEARSDARQMLDWIVNEVIRGKRARAFLVTEADSNDPLMISLFDERVLHLVRRGYSAQDDPGTRYNVWNIDYGAYVDLLKTKNAPRGALAVEDDQFIDVDVPAPDHRAIRRAILSTASFRESLDEGDSAVLDEHDRQ